MANSTVYPYGTNGELPTSIGIINDTTTGGADKALSAQQGKVLGDLLRNARPKEIDFDKLTRANYSLYSNKKWGITSASLKEQHVVIPCVAGDKFILSMTSEGTGTGNFYGWLTSSYTPPTSASTTPYVSGEDRIWVENATFTVTAPETAAYLCLVVVNGGTAGADRTSWQIYKIEDLEESLKDSITDDEFVANTQNVDALPFVKEKHYTITGAGTGWAETFTDELVAGANYKLVIDSLHWVDNTLLDSNTRYQFIIDRVDYDSIKGDDSHYVNVVTKHRNDNIQAVYSFTAGNNKYYRVGGRFPSGYTFGFTLYRQLEETELNDVTEEVLSLIDQAKAGSNSILGLLHYSDIHGDTFSANRILKAMDKLSDKINDAVCTGDVVTFYADGNTTYPAGVTWWQASGLPEKSLYILGNHDGATTSETEYDVKRGNSAWDGKGKEWDYQNYFANYISGLGYVMPDGYDDSASPNYHACYWHKDYAAAKVRLIGIDGMHRCDGIVDPTTGAITAAGNHWNTNEQELWLIDRLNETLDSEDTAYGYSVVFLGHYCLDIFSGDNNSTNTRDTGGRVIDYKTGAASNFHLGINTSFSLQQYGFDYRSKSSNYGNLTNNNFADIIMSWKGRGGKFVAWVCGHMHHDLFFYPTNYPELLCISVNQAGWLRPSSYEYRQTPQTRMLANYYAIDTTNGLFKIVRLGLNKDYVLRPTNYLCYDYINKKVLNEG